MAALGIEGAAEGTLLTQRQRQRRWPNLVKEHRLSIAPTYADLMAMSPTGRYDPTNKAHLSYNQAMNLENYLYLGVASWA